MNFIKVSSNEELSVDAITNLIDQQDDSLSILASTKIEDFLGALVNLNDFEYETQTTQFFENVCQEIRQKWSTIKNIALFYRFGLISYNQLNMVIAATSTRDLDAIQATEWCSNYIKENLPVLSLQDLQINCDLNPAESDLINVSVGVEELNRRINKFADKACSQSNLHNKINFIESENVNHVSCARVDAAFTKRQYSNGYAMVNQKDLTKCVNVKTEEEDCDVDMCDDFMVDESIYKRLKDAEDRLMNVESISPLNIGYWDETVCVERTSYKRKEWSIDNVDGMISVLESRQAKIPKLDET